MIVRAITRAIVLHAVTAAAAQPSAVEPIPAPMRDLPWSQLNFLHTTDTHGWHAGHLQEAAYSADWGDYISFAERLHERADAEGVDLLLIDTGDRIEGNGLYDASKPKGKYDLSIFDQQNIDVICSGNHELYKAISIEYEYNTTVPHFKDNYLASNLDVVDVGSGKRKALSQRYKKFVTRNQGIRVLSFGFLYDFTMGANNIFVQRVEDTIRESWFQEAIRDREVDLFLVIGHVAPHSREYKAVYKAIREQQWDVPIQFFGGHTHIRDYAKYDSKAFVLQSGRYFETIGFMSIDGLNTGGKESIPKNSNADPTADHGSISITKSSPVFSRRYIDNNLFSYYHHTSLNASTFATPHGRNVSAMITAARKTLDLDYTYGCAPQTYWTNRAPFPSPDSIFTLLSDHVFPETIQDDDRGAGPRIVIANTGGIRFDIFEGRFTTDTMFTVSPFTSGFRYIKNVPFHVEKQLLRILNHGTAPLWPIDQQLAFKSPSVINAQSSPIYASSRNGNSQILLNDVKIGHLAEKPRTPGYTTHDAAGSDGDDTIHEPIQFFHVPNCIESRIDFPQKSSKIASSEPAAEPETVDLIYNEFIEKYILLALKYLGTDYEIADTAEYMPGKSMTWVIGEWVRKHWKCDG